MHLHRSFFAFYRLADSDRKDCDLAADDQKRFPARSFGVGHCSSEKLLSDDAGIRGCAEGAAACPAEAEDCGKRDACLSEAKALRSYPPLSAAGDGKARRGNRIGSVQAKSVFAGNRAFPAAQSACVFCRQSSAGGRHPSPAGSPTSIRSSRISAPARFPLCSCCGRSHSSQTATAAARTPTRRRTSRPANPFPDPAGCSSPDSSCGAARSGAPRSPHPRR